MIIARHFEDNFSLDVTGLTIQEVTSRLLESGYPVSPASMRRLLTGLLGTVRGFQLVKVEEDGKESPVSSDDLEEFIAKPKRGRRPKNETPVSSGDQAAAPVSSTKKTEASPVSSKKKETQKKEATKKTGDVPVGSKKSEASPVSSKSEASPVGSNSEAAPVSSSMKEVPVSSSKPRGRPVGSANKSKGKVVLSVLHSGGGFPKEFVVDIVEWKDRKDAFSTAMKEAEKAGYQKPVVISFIEGRPSQ